LAKTKDAIDKGTQILPQFIVLSPAAHSSKMNEALRKSVDQQMPQSPSRSGILESSVSAISFDGPQLLVDKYFHSASARSNSQNARRKKHL
jgi:hypothetical protein